MNDILLFLHILGAAGWIGAGLYTYFIFPRIARKGAEGRPAITEMASSADRFFGPAAGLVLLTGIGLVLESDLYGWSDTFVWVGISVFVLSAIWQPLVASKAEDRVMSAVAGEGAIGPAISAWRRVGLFDVAIVLIALWAMVVKLGVG